MEMIKRTKEQRSIELLQGLMKQDYAVDSANLDILEDLIEQAEKDEDSKLSDYDPIMYALNLAVRVTLEDVEYWDNDGDMEIKYQILKEEFLKDIGQ